MPAWLIGPLKNFALWLLEKLITKWISKAKDWYLKKEKSAKQDEIDKENSQKLKDAIKENKSDEEISKNTENLLNGDKS